MVCCGWESLPKESLFIEKYIILLFLYKDMTFFISKTDGRVFTIK